MKVGRVGIHGGYVSIKVGWVRIHHTQVTTTLRAPEIMTTHTRPPEERAFTPPRAIARVLRVIEVLADQARPMSLAELSAALDVPKTSLFAILKGLAQARYVVFENDTYVLGPRARRLAESIHGGISFADLARPILEGLVRATGETVILGTLGEDRRHVLYALVVESDSWLRFSVNVGVRRPLSAAASGHAILSYLPVEEREQYLASGPFERFTPKTVATRTALRKVIARVRSNGCAMTVDGTVTAATGIAAPYFDRRGAVVGAVLIAAPTSRVAQREMEIRKTAGQGAEAISRLLGYSGAYPP